MGIKLHEIYADIVDEEEDAVERLTETDALQLGLDTGDGSEIEDIERTGWRTAAY